MSVYYTDYLDIYDYGPKFKLIRQEDDYKMFYNRLHDWNKTNIIDLQLSLIESIEYFRKLPYKNLSIDEYVNLFDLSNSFFLHVNDSSFIVGPDMEGRCLQIKFLNKNSYSKVISISELENITK